MAPPFIAGAGVPTLLDCWRVRDLNRFRAVLKGGPAAGGLTASTPSQHASSYSKSPPYHSYNGVGTHGSWVNAGQIGSASPAEVNRKDHFGRTVLHLVASSDEGVSVEFLLALLCHPSCNVNVQDGESGYTALHRALYYGNLNHALTLLRHSSIDVRLKDAEGLSAFDLYNSTVSGTNPVPPDLLADLSARGGSSSGDLYLWGSNSNYTLGLGDGNDRALPDSVCLKRPDQEDDQGWPLRTLPAGHKFDRIQVKEVQMSKMHTVVITDEEAGGNVWVAGIGSNGRLGRSCSTQPTLTPLLDFKETAATVALGPDHTLIVTTSGSLYSFGLNKFVVLGYVLDAGQGLVASTMGSSGHATSTLHRTYDIQITPRKIAGPLKKEAVLGVAVSRLHSVAFSAEALYTWGSNTGQLGYDKNATPLQIQPRKVTSLTSSARQVACTDHATAVLLSTFDVLVLHGDLSFRLQFPMTRFSEKMSVFRPRQAQPKPSIAKITSSGSTFAALSDYGDLFTFSLGHPSEYATGSSVTPTKRTPAPAPQLVWSVRKKFTAVRDVAISMDGSIILCTSSGHVFVRSRRSTEPTSVGKPSLKTSAARGFRFAQIPYLQRVVKVSTNESGGFAAIRSHALSREIRIKGKTVEEDLLSSLPFLRISSDRCSSSDGKESQIAADIGLDVVFDDGGDEESLVTSDEVPSEGEDSGSSMIQHHSRIVSLLAEAARRLDRGPERFGPKALAPPPDCDMFVIAGGRYIPAHRAIIAARIQCLAPFLQDPPEKGARGRLEGCVIKKPRPDVTTLMLPGCSFHTALFLLYYLYTDDLPAVWTASVNLKAGSQLTLAKINCKSVQAQLKELASLLALPALTPCLNSPVPRTPVPTLRRDLHSFFTSSVDCAPSASLLHDTELVLADRIVPAHSVILRRSPFFSALLQPDWSSSRWCGGKIVIELTHLRWDVLGIHLRHMYSDGGVGELLNGLDMDKNQDEWFDYLTELLGASNELLLDRLKLIFSSLLRARTLPTNIAALLTISDTLHALPLKEASLLYCAQNLENLLEGGMLDDLEFRMVRDLGRFVKAKQDERLHRSIQKDHLAALVVKHQAYYDALDLPPPSLNLSCHKILQRPPSSRRNNQRASSPTASPEVRPTLSSQDSALFTMDEDEGSPSCGVLASRSHDLPGDQPNLLRLPKPLERSAAAPWLSRHSERDNPIVMDSEKAMSNGLRSIMAAEKARASEPPLQPSTYPFLSTTGRSASSGLATPPSTNERIASIGPTTPLRALGTPMAKEGSASAAFLPDLASLTITPKLSQKERKKLAQQQLVSPVNQDAAQDLSDSTKSSKASVWKPVAIAQAPTDFGFRSEPPLTTRPSLRQDRTVNGGRHTPSGPSSSPYLGPTFTPTKTRVPSLPRSGSDAVWAKPNAAFSSHGPLGSVKSHQNVQGTITMRPMAGSLAQQCGPSSAGMTFADIQAQQEAAAAVSDALMPLRKSFAEIQAEDHEVEVERIRAERERVEFEKWFEEESRRVKAAARISGRQPTDTLGNKSGKKKCGSGGQTRNSLASSQKQGPQRH